MIRDFTNGMLTLMLAKFVLNDLPHVAGILGNHVEHSDTIVYHIAPREAVPSIMKKGLLPGRFPGLYFIAELEPAKRMAEGMEETSPRGSKYAILEITLLESEIPKCVIGEGAPTGEQPRDIPLSSHVKGQFMLPEVHCDIAIVPPSRIRVVR